MALLHASFPTELLPVIALTADIAYDERQSVLAAGVEDFVTKPFDVTEVLLRVRNMLDPRRPPRLGRCRASASGQLSEA